MEKIDSLLDTIAILTEQIKSAKHEIELFKRMYSEAADELLALRKQLKEKEEW